MLGGMQQISRDRMGDPPMLIGEFGIPYEMNGGEAYRTGDWSKQESRWTRATGALTSCCCTRRSGTTPPDNAHDHGDQWNDEDLSIFSPDDVTDPDDINSGGRAIRAFCRPYVRHWAGAPGRMCFDLASGEFTRELRPRAGDRRPDRRVRPPVHYPEGTKVVVSTGETTFHPGDPAAVVVHPARRRRGSPSACTR